MLMLPGWFGIKSNKVHAVDPATAAGTTPGKRQVQPICGSVTVTVPVKREPEPFPVDSSQSCSYCRSLVHGGEPYWWGKWDLHHWRAARAHRPEVDRLAAESEAAYRRKISDEFWSRPGMVRSGR